MQVNEKGTEAAASTGIVGMGADAPINEPLPVKFLADQLFLFVIVERAAAFLCFLVILLEIIEKLYQMI